VHPLTSATAAVCDAPGEGTGMYAPLSRSAEKAFGTPRKTSLLLLCEDGRPC